jgi:hypothetical protein
VSASHIGVTGGTGLEQVARPINAVRSRVAQRRATAPAHAR